MWGRHEEYCEIRRKIARDFSNSFRNVYMTSKKALRDLNLSIERSRGN